MAEQICKVITCDKCNGNAFLGLRQEKIVDGCHTVLDSFEPRPEGWKQWYDINMLLCPTCSAIYAEVLKGFEKGVITSGEQLNTLQNC